jgi:endonuclease-3 related protein
MHISKELFEIFDRLERSIPLESGWPGGNWPLSGYFEPREFEIVIGAILTQNTNWRNVEKALVRLREADIKDASDLTNCPLPSLEEIVKPAGFFRKKSQLLKRVAEMILGYREQFYTRVKRHALLSIRGIGPETADAILLYACGRPEFIADAYTRRILRRYGFSVVDSYGETKDFLEMRLPPRVALFRRFHALLVEQAKAYCRKVPLCSGCTLRDRCDKEGVQAQTHAD